MARPGLESDVAQGINEPDLEEIERGLVEHGHSNEAAIWREALEGCR
jgi:hypothetical protein